MTLPAGKPGAVALLLAAGIIAILIAVVFAFAPGVGADPCVPNSVPADLHSDGSNPCDNTDHDDDSAHYRIQVVPDRTSEGRRGDTFTLSGRGFPQGTVTIFEGVVENGIVLDTEIVGSSGNFTSDLLTVRGSPSNLEYVVTAIDSEGRPTEATFEISKETISFEPHTAVIDSTLKIIVADWQEDMSKGVAAVRIGGKDALISQAIEYDNCIDYTHRRLADSNHVLTLDVTVSSSTLTGTQTVSLYDYDQLDLTGAIGSTTTPCTEVQDKGNQLNSTVTAKLGTNPIPIIQATVRVITPGQVPPVAPPAQKIITVDGGRDRELALKAYPPGDVDIHLDASDQIEISLPEFDLSGASFKSTGELGVIKISGSVLSPAQIDANASGGKLTLTLSNAVSVSAEAGESLDITITEGAGILTPETPRGFDDSDDGYPVAITFVDKGAGQQDTRTEAANNNIVVVKNPISSDVPGATVRVELVAYADVIIGSSEEIVVDFSGPSVDSEFFVPASISNTRVTIRPKDKSSFNPSEILVQGARVTLTIPSGTSPKSIPAGEFTITFSNLARIRNPFAAGIRDIKVLSFVPGDLEDVIKAVIRRTTTIDTLEGPRGTEFILQGKGYPSGTVTVYHDANCDGNIDAGETLASDNTVRGAFSVDLVAREPRELGTPGCPLDPLVYRVKAKDSEGVDDEIPFLIKSGMFFQPVPARVGSPLKITISDWQDNFPDVVAVSIAGEQAYVAEVREYQNCFEYTGVFRPNSDGMVYLEVDVPRFVPGGEQTVAVHGHEGLEHYEVLDDETEMTLTGANKPVCTAGERKGSGVKVIAKLKSEPQAIIKATVEIDIEDLTLSPAMAARGQRVTITGSGFTRASRGGNHIESVWIGGKRVEDDPAGFEVGTDGSIAFPVTVPLEVADGDNEVRIEGADHTLGQATLTVPEASITLEPAQGQRGAELVITGSGFIARELVLLDYYSDEVVTKETTQLAVSGLLADSQGGFEMTFKVPVTAEVGKSHLITAVAEMDTREGTVKVNAEAKHLVTQAGITTSPDSVSPGDHLTVSGEALPPFTLVGPIRIAGIEVTPASEVATDENGAFEARVLIPQMDFGDQTLTVQVAWVILPHIVNVAPPPLSGPPSQVFKYLIRDGVLLTVWHYDNATQAWSLFDPLLAGEIAELNDLTEVSSGDILWIDLREPRYFQGNDLDAGWNLIRLK